MGTTVERWDRARLVEAVTEYQGGDPDAIEQTMALMDRWMARGDGVAVYENHDFNSSMLGHRQFASYGSPAALLEVSEPPTTMPDVGSAINWRYQLIAVSGGPAA